MGSQLKRGRPTFKPTGKLREQVITLSSNGLPHIQIAPLIGCSSPKTLRKHFREELNLGKIQANAKVAGALYQLALEGNVKAQSFWLKTVGGCRRLEEWKLFLKVYWGQLNGLVRLLEYFLGKPVKKERFFD